MFAPRVGGGSHARWRLHFALQQSAGDGLKDGVPCDGNSGRCRPRVGRDGCEDLEAERVLRAAVGRDRRNPFAWYQLGVVYAARGDTPRARLASAEQQVMSGQYGLALRSAQAAEHGLERGTPDWIRAQDIGMQARALLERQCEMERGRNCAPG